MNSDTTNPKHVQEIIDRKDFEEALHERERDLNRAQAVAQTGSWRLNVRRNQLLWSDETYRIFGIPKGTPLTYEKFLSQVHPDDRYLVARTWTAALRGEPYDIEHRIAGEQVKWVREKAELEFDSQGELLGGFGTVQDITRLKEMEEELRRARDELSVIVAERTAELLRTNEKLKKEVAKRELAQRELKLSNEVLRLATRAASRKEYLDGVVELLQKWSGCSCAGIRVLDEEGNIPYETYLGFEQEFLNRENWLSIKTDHCACIRTISGKAEPQDAPCLSPNGSFVLNNSAEFLKTLSEEEVKRFRGFCIASGFMSIALIAIRDKDQITGAIHIADKRPYMVPEELIGFIENLSPLVGEGIRKFNMSDALNRQHELLQRTEKQLKHYAEELQSANRELQDFAHIASHDLREPLRKISWFSDIIRKRYDDALDDSGRELLRRLQGATGRMRALLDRLLAYSHVTTRTNPIRATDLAILAEEVISDLELLIERKGARVHLGELPVAEVDPTQFMQLLQNLISNGLKYNDSEKPEVRIFSETYRNGTFLIYVEDNGIGFDEQFLGRIFQPFQRLHGRGSKFEGTGMGLAICRKIVERHGGTITAKSSPGKGSRFIISLPAVQGRGRQLRKKEAH